MLLKNKSYRFTWQGKRLDRYRVSSFRRHAASWQRVEDQRAFLDNLASKFKIVDKNQWYSFSALDVKQNGGKLLLERYYDNNLFKLLHTIYPGNQFKSLPRIYLCIEHKWDPAKFQSVNRKILEDAAP